MSSEQMGSVQIGKSDGASLEIAKMKHQATPNDVDREGEMVEMI